MNPRRALGLVLILIGALLLIVGIGASKSVGDQLSNFFTGRFTDKTVWYLVAGVTSTVVGLALTFVGRRGNVS